MMEDILHQLILSRKLTYPTPASTFESIIVVLVPIGGICDRSQESRSWIPQTLAGFKQNVLNVPGAYGITKRSKKKTPRFAARKCI